MLRVIAFLAMISVQICSLTSTENQQAKNCFQNNDDGSAEPLFLTPLIEDKNRPRQEIRNMARIDRSQFIDVESYAGYLTVDKNFNSNMFFWYFPPEQNVTDAPVLLWLQGGPGVSSMWGLLTELGPLDIDNEGRMKKRNYTWSREHHLIFIDNPVGVGFSFTDREEGYAQNEEDVGRNLHEAMMQLYELFEWNESSDFWATGESYAGKYAPALAYQIHKTQAANKARVHIPLKGLALGNGYCDPINQIQLGDYLYQLGLIDEHGLAEFHDAEQKIVKLIEAKNLRGAFDLFDSLINQDFTNDTLFRRLSGFNYKYNFLMNEDDGSFERTQEFFECAARKRALNVGNREFHGTIIKVYEKLKLDFMDTVAPWLGELLDNYTICFYNGQLDILAAYSLMRNFLQKLKFSAADEYMLAKRNIWYVDGELAGYSKSAGNLIEVLVRNASHVVPRDQPKWAYNLIQQLTKYKTVK